MTEPKRGWIGRGSMAMALAAALALGVTVLIAQRALAHASEVVMRGEADGLVSTIVGDITQADQDGSTTTKAWLERELGAHADRGLRYLAIVQHDGVVAEAGTATMPDVRLHPGETFTVEKRVRVTGYIPPMRPQGGFGGPFGPRPHQPPALLVVELEPPMIEQLRGNLRRISFVAAGAAGVLVVFALALSRSARRLAEIEQKAAREQRLVALGSMSSVMAHELRNPLASLKGHAQLLAEDLDEGKAKKKAERVVAEAQRIEDLTTSLLDFVRDGPIEATECTPAALVDRALADLPRARIDVKTDEMSPFVVDTPRLARAVHNLVDNALKATEDEGRVELSITREPPREGSSGEADVVVTVRDHGAGITDGEKMFEPFVTTRVRGTGLGLPVARRIAEQHGGSLVGANHPGGGAIFTLRFPARGSRERKS